MCIREPRSRIHSRTRCRCLPTSQQSYPLLSFKYDGGKTGAAAYFDRSPTSGKQGTMTENHGMQKNFCSFKFYLSICSHLITLQQIYWVWMFLKVKGVVTALCILPSLFHLIWFLVLILPLTAQSLNFLVDTPSGSLASSLLFAIFLLGCVLFLGFVKFSVVCAKSLKYRIWLNSKYAF